MTNIRLKEATLLTNEKKLPVSKYISNNGLKSHYADWEGAGPTTLLVHGNMRTSRSFDAVSRNLSADHHVIAMDLIGHGNSTWAKQGYKLQDRCEDIGNFVNKNNLNNIFAVGHSMGAVGLAMLVANDDSRFDKLVLLEPMMEIQSRFHRPESERTPRHRRTWNDHTELYKLLKKHKLTRKWRPEVIKDVVEFETYLDKNGRVDMKWEPATLSWSEREDEYMDLVATLRKISIPILFVVGETQKHEFERAFELEKTMSNLETLIVSGAGHNMYMERPKAVSEAIRIFGHTDPLPPSL